MFIFEIASWLILSVILVGAHIYIGARPHPRIGFTTLTGGLWGLAGGALGMVIQLGGWVPGHHRSGLPLLLAGVATVVYLFLEWASSHDHRRPVSHR